MWLLMIGLAAQTAVASPAPCPSPKAIGKAVMLRRDAALPLAPAKPAPRGSYAGTMPLPVSKAGTYRVAISDGAWIDMVRSGRAVASTAHGHGEPCSGVAKFVEFKLDPGSYTIELSGAKTSVISVAVSGR